jgi:hypothetical protein
MRIKSKGIPSPRPRPNPSLRPLLDPLLLLDEESADASAEEYVAVAAAEVIDAAMEL